MLKRLDAKQNDPVCRLIVNTVLDLINGKRALLFSHQGCPYCDAKHVAMLIMYEQGYSNTSIGRFFNRDRPTVIYSRKKIQNMLEIEDPLVKRLYEATREALEQSKIEVCDPV